MHFKIYQDTRREWRWRLVAANNRTLADSAEGYTSKQSCLHALGLIRGQNSTPIYE